MFVIVRSDGKYVAQPGYDASYTPRLESARTFRLKENAEKHCCPENERVVAIAELLCHPTD